MTNERASMVRALSRGLLVALAFIGLLDPFFLDRAAAQPDTTSETARLASIEWTSFVASTGERPQRQVLSTEPGQIGMMGSPWRCGFARARYAQIATEDWSVQRVLACRRGEATVSATASCRIHAGQLDERAVTLSLGTVDETAHATVTLSCQLR